ncbi:transglutaminase domain-containing protein [Calothrix sp. NIES-4101]|nr:transglutaminase domain-containing protein [Calothrix sp. NIES-4101]
MLKFTRINRLWRLPQWMNWQQSVFLPSLSETESSVPLRVLVLLLVTVGIIAKDIAAETQSSFWAVPLSIVGASWSYYRRHNRNVSVKFGIAIGMLVALGAFFGRLLGELNDTRLVLAELLIQLQVLHSYDMPRRKDLGYSIVIGVILLGVAATLSQTLAFAPVLLVFLGVALPTLIFDYRSRLGITNFQEKKEKRKSERISAVLPSYFLLFTLILATGLGIFAILPRFPGYQMRMFPVSSNIEVKGNFTGRSIINPGYVRQGNGNGNGTGTGSGGSGEPGQVDSSFYYGFNSRMNQNLRGEMKPKVVMRVRSQIEGFWRVLAFDKYTGKGWEISRNEKTQTFKRSPWSYQIFLPRPNSVGTTQEVVQTYAVVDDMPNLIPAMSYPKEVYFPAPMIAVDTENSLRAPVNLVDGFTYTVVSEVPIRDRTLLGKAGTTYPASITKNYLEIPSEIADKVRDRTEEILANYNKNRVGQSEKSLDSNYEKALYLAQYLKQHYKIPESLNEFPFLTEKEDLVEAFLFKYKGGYPDYFSTTLTVMLRSIGIPARLVTGFASGQFNPFTGMYIVRNTDAYAMTEVYFPKYGWFAFDPIPNHPLIPPSVEETQTFSVLQHFWKWVAGWLPSPISGFLNNLFEVIFTWLTKTFLWFFGLFAKGWFGIVQGLIIATAFGFSGWLTWQGWKKLYNRSALRKLPPMESLYQQMLQWTDAKGLGKHPSQTPLEFAKVSYQQHTTATAEVIDEICQAYVDWRYGGYAPNLHRLRSRLQEMKRITNNNAWLQRRS